MQDQASAPAVELRVDDAEGLVLALVLGGSGPVMWSVGELGREIGCETRTIEAVVALRVAGLVNCCEQFVFASRAAVRMAELLRRAAQGRTDGADE